MSADGTPDLEFCAKLPKVELHAHLSGSLSRQTLGKLLDIQGRGDSDDAERVIVAAKETQSYSDAFDLFKLLHRLVVDIPCLDLAVRDVIEEFYRDNVLYLELRSTPKCLRGCSKRDYVDCIVRAVQSTRYEDMATTLLISIDRGRSVQDAEENLKLAIEYNKMYPDVVLGVDFSGNPHCGDVKEFLPLFADAKSHGLVLSLHVGEVQDVEENLALLQAKPDRVGHAIFIHPNSGGDQSLYEELRKNGTPIEICLSSNVIAGIASSYVEHPFGDWYQEGHRLALCTDDKGLFDTTLSKEYFLVSQAFKLSRSEVARLSWRAVDCISGPVELKAKLKAIWKRKLIEMNILFEPEFIA